MFRRLQWIGENKSALTLLCEPRLSFVSPQTPEANETKGYDNFYKRFSLVGKKIDL